MKIILGTMTFGGQTTEKDATIMVKEFEAGLLSTTYGIEDVNPWDIEIDTAIMYQNGQTEHILGRILPKVPTIAEVKIASKANPFTKDKNLSPANLRQQLESSLDALNAKSIDLYYLHAPDVHNNIEPTLEEIQKLYMEGKFQRFGLSNFTAWETVYIHNYMSQRQGYVVPTVYQGMYNAITRQVEIDLFPALRKLNMSFYAYNPLAAGMLTGKYNNSTGGSGSGGGGTGGGTGGNDPAKGGSSKPVVAVGTRFEGQSFWAKRYRERYQQKEQFAAVEILRHVINDYNSNNNNNDDDTKKTGESNNSNNTKEQQEDQDLLLTMTDASLKWLKYHSCLDPTKGDGIILGASSIQHFRTNWKSLMTDDDGETFLPPEIVQAFDDAWAKCKSVCPDYSRGYSGSAAKAAVAK